MSPSSMVRRRSGLYVPRAGGGGGGGGSYDTNVLADTPLLYWKINETSGASVADSSGNSHPGTMSAGTLGGSPVMPSGVSTYTNSSSGQVLLSTLASWQLASSFTAEAWIKASSWSSYHNVFNRDGTSARGWNLYVTGGKLNGFDGAGDKLSTGATLATGTAYHVAATCDGVTVKLYINGALDYSFAATGGWLNNASGSGSGLNAFAAAASLAGSGTFQLPLAGSIDHIAYYGSVLSAARLAAHYAAA